MPGLMLASKAFATPGIKGLLEKRPDVRARVAKANWVSALRVQSGAKRKAPVLTGRLRQSINIQKLDEHGLELSIGTNVVARLPRGKRKKAKALAKMSGWKFGTPRGYNYPGRMEYDETLQHTTGEWGYFRKSAAAEHEKHVDQCRRALIRGLKGYQ